MVIFIKPFQKKILEIHLSTILQTSKNSIFDLVDFSDQFLMHTITCLDESCQYRHFDHPTGKVIFHASFTMWIFTHERIKFTTFANTHASNWIFACTENFWYVDPGLI